jgi:hypothetical protein
MPMITLWFAAGADKFCRRSRWTGAQIRLLTSVTLVTLRAPRHMHSEPRADAVKTRIWCRRAPEAQHLSEPVAREHVRAAEVKSGRSKVSPPEVTAHFSVLGVGLWRASGSAEEGDVQLLAAEDGVGAQVWTPR